MKILCVYKNKKAYFFKKWDSFINIGQFIGVIKKEETFRIKENEIFQKLFYQFLKIGITF